MSLVVFTALAGFVDGSCAALRIRSLLLRRCCRSPLALAPGALNMWYDADIDAVMSRTSKRPIPSGRLDAASALAFGVVLSILSLADAVAFVTNLLAAGLLAFT
jgi:protoheme IX farnesyltransferase